MKKTISKKEAVKRIEEFFSEIKNKNPKEIKKIKRLAMNHKISLREERKMFCKKCFALYKSPKIRISRKIKSVTCNNCGYISRWKIK